MYREVFPQWQPAPAELRLLPGRVDVWQIALAAPPPAARDAAHAAMYDVLGRYLQRPVGKAAIRFLAGGKPYVALPGAAIDFNLSHCSDLALLAITIDASVGIDVEGRRTIDDPLRLARRVFAAHEVDLLAALPPDQRTVRFLELWTRMEARQKATGRGIFAAPADPRVLSNVAFRPDPGHFASLSLAPPAERLDVRFFDYRRT